MSDGELILVAGALMIAGLAATLGAERLRVPGLVLFLGLGMAIGSDASLAGPRSPGIGISSRWRPAPPAKRL